MTHTTIRAASISTKNYRFFAEVIVKGGNLQITLLTPDIGNNRSHTTDLKVTKKSLNASAYLPSVTPLKCHFVMPIHVFLFQAYLLTPEVARQRVA
jgi:hypothetical protein